MAHAFAGKWKNNLLADFYPLIVLKYKKVLAKGYFHALRLINMQMTNLEVAPDTDKGFDI